MSDPVFLCTNPHPPYSCTHISSSRESVVDHLVASHSGIPLFRRRYGAAALTQLPIAATLLRLPDATLNAALPVFVCDGCEVYFVHPRAFIEHLVTDASHAEACAAEIDQLGEFNWEDLMLAEHSRHLVLGAPPARPPPPPPQAATAAPRLRRRLMVNFTRPYTRTPASVNLDATTTTIAELTNILQCAYGQGDHDQIDWARIWHQGLVLLYSMKEGGTGRMTVYNDVDVVELVGKMDFGECCIGDERRN